jgi:DNA-binding response OmpR family regulator
MTPIPRPNPDTAHLLVVDDEKDILALAKRYFTTHGFKVSTAGDGDELRAVLGRGQVDLVLLDLGLPGDDGLELTRFLHDTWRGPLIIISGRGDSVDRVVGLELGADDYVTKPFDLRELLARVRSVLRRSRAVRAVQHPGRRIRFASYTLDLEARRLTQAGDDEVPLTTGEFELLSAFLEHPGRVLSRDELVTRMHGRDAGPFDRSIDMLVQRLRRKIEPDPAQPMLIKAVRGAGYLFTAKLEGA